MQPTQQNDLRNLLLTLALSFAIMFGWNFFYQPRQPSVADVPNRPIARQVQVSFKQADPHPVALSNANLKGSISSHGPRVDHLTLLKYSESDGQINLLKPSSDQDGYWAQLGWISDGSTQTPTSDTIWSVSGAVSPEKSAVYSWQNKDGIAFDITFSMDEHYMLTAVQTVTNRSKRTVSMQTYCSINRKMPLKISTGFAHEGAVGVFSKELQEKKLEDLKTSTTSHYNSSRGGWFGIGDKYWLVAAIPDGEFSGQFRYVEQEGDRDRYQINSLAKTFSLLPGRSRSTTTHIFVGPKSYDLLSNYRDLLKIDLFDRAIDFGWLYFLTKPMSVALRYLHEIFGNFGIAIIVMTALTKLLLLPLAISSSKTTHKLKALKPQIDAIKIAHPDDKLKQQRATMDLYAKEGIKPGAGLVGLLFQIPVFFSLYKILSVMIEMRHAPFYMWITDLSASDPTNIFNAFGLAPWNPPAFLHIGALPVLMGITQYVQHITTAKSLPDDQVAVMRFLPLIFTFMLASMPSGLVLYWTCSNIFSIAQQFFLDRLNARE